MTEQKNNKKPSKVFFANIIQYAIPFAIVFFIFFTGNLETRIVATIISTTIFYVVMTLLAIRQEKKRFEMVQSELSEEILLFANAYRDTGKVLAENGTLALTKTKLVFLKKSKNREKLEFPLLEIEKVEVCKYRLNGNAFSFECGGNQEKLVFMEKNLNTQFIDLILKAQSELKAE